MYSSVSGPTRPAFGFEVGNLSATMPFDGCGGGGDFVMMATPAIGWAWEAAMVSKASVSKGAPARIAEASPNFLWQ